ncbi:MAG: ABC transporter ATP-binding protein [Planctomycetota bacterium]|jgi:putative ABC transport system ATP-binding protein|nr:ABC transporter ATP-binding protein [Planctomycetota bacterium]MDP6763299.1 ABC transporter ATP-binding protein [Planctomycetota bacterium]MDP6987977.1 ABC transporter ATP-binding protein [Planctomycetota bacterium]
MSAASDSAPRGPVLVVEDLAKTFTAPDGERTKVVDVPSFSLAEGEQVAVEGASGSGKTTFLHLIAGILEPDSGSILIDGEDMAALSEAGRDRLRARSIGYVFQSFHLLQGYSALENVLLGMHFGPGPDLGRARSLLEQVGLADRLDHRPRQLSVGQQQRVAVARAVANRPRLLLADEPTGNLDPSRAGEALELLRAVSAEAGSALLLVSHDRGILECFGRVESFEGLRRAGEVSP